MCENDSLLIFPMFIVSYFLLHKPLGKNSYTSSTGNRCNKTVELYRTVREPLVTELTRGLPLHCTYRFRLRPPRDDWIVFLRFTRLRVGELSPGRTNCSGGFIQIIDGNKNFNSTNPGEKAFVPSCTDTFLPSVLVDCSSLSHISLLITLITWRFSLLFTSICAPSF